MAKTGCNVLEKCKKCLLEQFCMWVGCEAVSDQDAGMLGVAYAKAMGKLL